jgi:hypothetical protein
MSTSVGRTKFMHPTTTKTPNSDQQLRNPVSETKNGRHRPTTDANDARTHSSLIDGPVRVHGGSTGIAKYDLS